VNSNTVNQQSNVAGQSQIAAIHIDADPDEMDDLAAEAGMMASAREVPAWAISLGVHVLVLFLLWSIAGIAMPEQQTIINSVMEEIDEDSYKFETQADQVGTDSNVNLLGPSLNANEHVSQDPQKEMEKKLEEELLEVSEPITDPIEQPAEALLAEAFDSTGTTEHTGGTEGAIDRLAFEIAASLREKKTLAIWLFDASLSLKKRRDMIADRFANVYKQVDHLNVGADRALKTAVASYGNRTQIITPEPVDDATTVVEAIRNIAPDVSGKEHVFAAVKTVSNKWLSYRTKMRRNIMIIIVTDERGDDYAMVEQVSADLARYGIKVYCVGNASIFGREKGYVEWEYEDGFKEEIPVDQGPESVNAERMELPFWGGGNDNRKYERLSAGYGPYALTRLCAETGGVYFVADQGSIRFDSNVMRDYQPDYRPRRDYIKDVKANLAKSLLVQAAAQTRQLKFNQLRLRFEAPSDNVLRTQITAAQRPAAEFDHNLTEMLTLLSQGEKARDKIKEPRWRANYDLAMGRVLAMRVRAFGYNRVLAEMKSEPKSFKKKGSNSWTLQPSREINAGPVVKKLAKQATMYLTRVIDDHPATPWAMLAERELGQAMGWQWAEGTMNIARVNTRPGPDADAATLQLAEEERKRREMQKKKVKKRTPPQL
jgi:hypothetical protein